MAEQPPFTVHPPHAVPNHVQSIRPAEARNRFGILLHNPPLKPLKPGIGPWGRGPLVRSVADKRQATVGQWALVADGAKEARSRTRIMINSARSESLGSRPTFRGPWARRQRCLIPADSFLELNWESGKNE